MENEGCICRICVMRVANKAVALALGIKLFLMVEQSTCELHWLACRICVLSSVLTVCTYGLDVDLSSIHLLEIHSSPYMQCTL